MFSDHYKSLLTTLTLTWTPTCSVFFSQGAVMHLHKIIYQLSVWHMHRLGPAVTVTTACNPSGHEHVVTRRLQSCNVNNKACVHQRVHCCQGAVHT